ncbi:hypothetical protein KY290_034880 [Solanum tuberosum]|uniref:Transmembrane protein n=1 Tax=Solanum tuberosum TaxID=4113 RepID=A0ABQ7U4G2_SOLTU|nr:hypothetical protein KY284_033950 [Solanum tuberosum]KAH0741837.1 hypothetical protein KY290_034880 [Solanum tuberosum]
MTKVIFLHDGVKKGICFPRVCCLFSFVPLKIKIVTTTIVGYSAFALCLLAFVAIRPFWTGAGRGKRRWGVARQRGVGLGESRRGRGAGWSESVRNSI